MFEKVRAAFGAGAKRKGLNDAELARRLSASWAGKQVGGGGKHILVACMPKSASTFLTSAIGNLPGFQTLGLPFHYDRREQELDVFLASCLHDQNYATQAHVRYSEPTGMILRSFNIFPVVLVRNIFDCVVSFCDHLNTEDTAGSMGYFDPGFREWPREKQLDAVIDLAMPWYANFFACWSNYKGPCVRTSYDEIMIDTPSVIMRALAGVGHEASDGEIRAAIESARGGATRFNVGRSGRGGEQLSIAQIERVRRLFGYYEDIPGVEAILQI